MKRTPNHAIQRMGASHFGQSLFGSAWRLAPTADGNRSAMQLTATSPFGVMGHQEALRLC
jgi:hypothetical protein